MTAGILAAHTGGIVTSTSMMVHCPGWEDGVARARATPTLDIGLHFNLLVGAPRTAALSLRSPSGSFLSLPALARRAVMGRVDQVEVAAECEAQLDALVDAGIRVTHLDSHRHTHALPGIYAPVASVARAWGLVLRRPTESGHVVPGGMTARVRARAIAWSWRVAAGGRRGSQPPPAPEWFAGSSWRGDSRYAWRLARFIDRLPPGTTELMVHPGYADPELSAVDGYTTAREQELAALTDPSLADRLRRRGVTLVGFDAL